MKLKIDTNSAYRSPLMQRVVIPWTLPVRLTLFFCPCGNAGANDAKRIKASNTNLFISYHGKTDLM